MTPYLVPFSYGWTTRAKTAEDKLSFFMIWVLPLWFACNSPISLRFVAAIAAQYSLYEVGYIFNDFITIKKENSPNFRLSESDRERVQKRLPAIVASRLVVVAALLIILDNSAFCAALAFLMTAFSLHNAVRSRWNILTYFLLCMGKYSALPALFVPVRLGSACLAFFAAFVLPRTLEHAAKPKYGIHALKVLAQPAFFRAAYEWSAAVFFAFISPGSLAFYTALWFYAYRALSLALILRFGDPRKSRSDNGAA